MNITIHIEGLTTETIRDTNWLKDLLGKVDVRLLDHFIIGAGEPASLADLGHI